MDRWRILSGHGGEYITGRVENASPGERHLPYGPLLTLGGRGLVSLLRISQAARTFEQNSILFFYIFRKGNMTQLSLLVMSM
jgi:hypothetical protein